MLCSSITWEGSEKAGGYRVWTRNINQAGTKLDIVANVTEQTCNEQYFLFPGVWNYAFAVSAFNGEDESDQGAEVAAPSPSSTEPNDFKCPPKESWCPRGVSVSVPPGGTGAPGPTTTSGGGPFPTDTTRPIVTNGNCSGPDCKKGQCSGMYHLVPALATGDLCPPLCPPR